MDAPGRLWSWGCPIPTISAAVEARILSTYKSGADGGRQSFSHPRESLYGRS